MTPHSAGAEERNIPIRICLTRGEWDALDELGTLPVHIAIESLIAAVVANKALLRDVKKIMGEKP